MPRERRHAIVRNICVQSRDSCTCFLAFSTFFGRELKAEKEGRYAVKCLKSKEVRL